MTAPRSAVLGLRDRLRDPRFHYRHGRLIHGARVAIGILFGMSVTYGLHIPDGEWTAISFIVVIAGLQHHGNIWRRAMERAAGTLLGAAAGLVMIGVISPLGIVPLTFVLIALFCGACGYHAIGRGGYVALLAAVTLIIVAGYGLDPISIGLWRTLNVLFGIAIALALTATLPIYARDHWRFGMTEALRRCADLLTAPDAPDGSSAGVETVGPVLIRLRPLMPPVARETHLPLTRLEAIQRHLRLFLSLLEVAADRDLLASIQVEGRPRWSLSADERQRIATRLAAIAEGLESGDWTLPWSAPDDGQSLASRTAEAELGQLRRLLIEAPALWSHRINSPGRA